MDVWMVMSFSTNIISAPCRHQYRYFSRFVKAYAYCSPSVSQRGGLASLSPISSLSPSPLAHPSPLTFHYTLLMYQSARTSLRQSKVTGWGSLPPGKGSGATRCRGWEGYEFPLPGSPSPPAPPASCWHPQLRGGRGPRLSRLRGSACIAPALGGGPYPKAMISGFLGLFKSDFFEQLLETRVGTAAERPRPGQPCRIEIQPSCS